MTSHDPRLSLELFNEKFEALLSSRFYQRARTEGCGVSVSFDAKQPMDPVFTGPRESDCKDFINDLRLYFHRKEALDLKGIEAVYIALDTPEDLLSRLREALAKFDEYRNGKTPYTLGTDHITQSKLYHVFVFGSVAHLNQDKRRIYEKWKKNPSMFALLESYFLQVLSSYVRFLHTIYVLNREALGFDD